MQRSKYPQIGVRVDPDFRAEVREYADRLYEGSEASLMRDGARLLIRLRRKLGPNFEPTIHALLGDPAEADERVPA